MITQLAGFESDRLRFETVGFPIAMIRLDPVPLHPNNRVWFNQAAAKLLGYSVSEVGILPLSTYVDQHS